MIVYKVRCIKHYDKSDDDRWSLRKHKLNPEIFICKKYQYSGSMSMLFLNWSEYIRLLIGRMI